MAIEKSRTEAADRALSRADVRRYLLREVWAVLVLMIILLCCVLFILGTMDRGEMTSTGLPRYTLAWLAGGLGSALSWARSLSSSISEGRWNSERWVSRFLMVPLGGSFAMMLLIAADHLLLLHGVDEWPAALVLAFLSGYWSDLLTAKLSEASDKWFGIQKLVVDYPMKKNQTLEDWLPLEDAELGTGVFLVADPQKTSGPAARTLLVKDITFSECVRRGAYAISFKWVPRRVRPEIKVEDEGPCQGSCVDTCPRPLCFCENGSCVRRD